MRITLITLAAIGSLLLLTHCNSKQPPESSREPIVTFRLSNMNTSAIYMYACKGSRQMLVDSLIVHGDSASIAIPMGTPPGMYRFMTNEAIVDLILSEEDIAVSLNGANDKGINIDKSSENKWLYDFFFSYNDRFVSDTISCESINDLKALFLNDKAPSYAKQYIELILQSADCDSKPICLNPTLLNCAYTDEILRAKLISQSKNDNVRTLFHAMLECSDSSNQVQHELYSACWDAGLTAMSGELLNLVLSESESYFSDNFSEIRALGKMDLLSAGSVFPTNSLISNYTPGSLNLYYLIIQDENSAELSQVKNYLNNTGDRYFVIQSKDLPQEVKLSIGYISGPMIFMIGKNDILADRWVGTRDIRNLR